jgi:predicted small integral membrane protein
MSLKVFHLFFVIIAALMCVGFGVWCFASPEAQTPTFKAAGILSFAAVAGLAVFEVKFLRRTKGLK